MNKIIVPQGTKGKLQKIFQTSHVTVRRALNGEGESLLRNRIRKAALELGGVEVKIVEKKTKKS